MWGHDASWWALVLAIAALILMIPASMVSNVLTPLLLNWIASWSSAALEKRIAKLENELAELEKNPAIDEVQEQILWGITTVRGMVLSLSTGVVLIFYVGIGMLANQTTRDYKRLTITIWAMLIVSIVGLLKLRYTHDFRYKHSPTVRKQFRKAIEDLKKLRRP
jgi:O-antigen/teichoic acid export membrane protein